MGNNGIMHGLITHNMILQTYNIHSCNHSLMDHFVHNLKSSILHLHRYAFDDATIIIITGLMSTNTLFFCLVGIGLLKSKHQHHGHQ